MKSLLTLLIALCLAASAFAAGRTNETLTTAQELLFKARTSNDYTRALNKFRTAKTDPGYVAETDDADIDAGIKACQAKLAQPSSGIMVNGMASPTVNFEADGGPITLEIDTRAKGRVRAKSNEPWLTVESTSKDSIVVKCEPNESKETRTATLTVSIGGASTKVKVSQAFIEFTISDIMLSSLDANGTEIVCPSSTLCAEEVLYLAPQFKLSGLAAPADKSIGVRVYAGRRLIASTDDAIIHLAPGDNIVKYKGWGDNRPGAWPKDHYTLEVWVDGKKEASKRFAITSKGLSVWDVEFAAADKKGRLKSVYDEPLYTEDTRCIKPRITYCGVPQQQIYTLDVKVFRADGTLDRNKKSPEGYSFSTTCTLYPGTNTCELPVWGTGKSKAYPEGEYTLQLWHEGKILCSTKFYVASKRNPVNINAVEYASVDKDGNIISDFGAELKSDQLQFLLPRISFSGLAKGAKKTICVKIFQPDGSMMRQPSSTREYTFTSRTTLAPGDNNVKIAAFGSAEGDTFAGGRYRIEYWVDNMRLYIDEVIIN